MYSLGTGRGFQVAPSLNDIRVSTRFDGSVGVEMKSGFDITLTRIVADGISDGVSRRSKSTRPAAFLFV
jgi:hypothetical protein